MIEADKMFEELGYNKSIFLDDIYYESGKISIVFDISRKKVIFHEKNVIDIQMLKAIYKKCEELGWI